MDISKRDVKVAVRVPGKRKGTYAVSVTTWGATVPRILELMSFLESQEVTVVVMESTSDYWKPFYYLMEGTLPVMLVNAKNARNIPGRKTDVSDAAWLAQLAAYGLLRGVVRAAGTGTTVTGSDPGTVYCVTGPGAGRATVREVPGINRDQTGADMTVFPTAGHLASWAGVCPGSNESAGKIKSAHILPGNKHLKAALGSRRCPRPILRTPTSPPGTVASPSGADHHARSSRSSTQSSPQSGT